MPTLDCSVPCSTLHLIDDVGHTKQVKITLSANGEVRRQEELKNMIWSVPEVISSLSRLFELYLVDLVFPAHRLGYAN